MILLEAADASSQSFKILLIASEIIIPIIVFIGVYFIFKPVFSKNPGEGEKKTSTSDNAESKADNLKSGESGGV